VGELFDARRPKAFDVATQLRRTAGAPQQNRRICQERLSVRRLGERSPDSLADAPPKVGIREPARARMPF
jgi:hypothetical protein